MADRRKNKFSIYRPPSQDSWIYESYPDENYGDSENLITSSDPAGGDSNIVMKTKIHKAPNDYRYIRHFDEIVGYRIMMFTTSSPIASPNCVWWELNDDLTKNFIEDEVTYNDYRSQCDWKTAGGDHENDNRIAGNIPSSKNYWYEWNLDDWCRNKSFKDEDFICTIMFEKGTTSEYAYFGSTRNTTDVTNYPKKGWRKEIFGGDESVWLNGERGNVYGIPVTEIVYEDEVPEPVKDFKITGEPVDGDRGIIDFSGSGSDDVQGYMVFASRNLQQYDFDDYQWGWVDSYDATEKYIVCGGMASRWSDDEWNDYYLIFTNGKKKGEVYTIADTNKVKYLYFDHGSTAFSVTDTVTGALSGANGRILEVNVSKGTWAGNDAEGYLVITDLASTPFSLAENISDVGGGAAQVLNTQVETAGGFLTLTESISAGDFDYNDMFIIIKGSIQASEIFSIKTNRGYYFGRAPDDDYEIYISDLSTWMVDNAQYNVFVQAIDNLSMGPRGDRSNLITIVKPKISATTDFKILASDDNDEGTSIEVYEKVYPVVYGVGMENTVTTPVGTSTTGLKGMRKIELEAGEYRYVLDTYSTVLTAEWSSDEDVTVDLSDIEPKYFAVGEKVAIVDRDATPTYVHCIRTIVKVGDNSLTLDEDNDSDTYRANTTIIYRVREFTYTKAGTKTTKCRIYNNDGIASAWQTASVAPAPISVPGSLSFKVGPRIGDKDDDTFNFNMNGCIPKPRDYTVQGYLLDKDDDNGLTEYTDPIQNDTYASTGTKRPYMAFYDDDDILTPGFAKVWDHQVGGGTYSDETVDARTYTAATLVTCLDSANDRLWIGCTEPFDGVYVDINSAWTDLVFDYGYPNGAATVDSMDDFSDGTSNFTESGKISWTRPTDWYSKSVNSSDELYWVYFNVTSVTAAGDIKAMFPIIDGYNQGKITVVDNVAIDLRNRNVLQNGFQGSVEGKDRKVYKIVGHGGRWTGSGPRGIDEIALDGVAYDKGDHLLSDIDSDGLPVWSGAANSNAIKDDVQVLDYIIENDLLVQFRDNAGNTWYGVLESERRPRKTPGKNLVRWNCKMVVDHNRSG